MAQKNTNIGMFDRRIGRRGFVYGQLYTIAFIAAAAFLQMMYLLFLTTTDGTGPSNGMATTVNIVSVLIGIAGLILLIPVGISLMVRRLHDLNLTGWLWLLNLVPVVGFLLFWYLVFAPGNRKKNTYGKPVVNYNIWVVLGFKNP